ncbi:hypothetical protein E2C01_064927 [Portunus trituberculatus]|uniref:Uncharacterized protein n=1 Tax=Portunus trituberculatus TaxID=210409 RepID=A0A5B7HHI1_PORTR|nr:hypothetical protein [Portunus trituberculatus]
MTLKMVLMAVAIVTMVKVVISEEHVGQYVGRKANFLNEYNRKYGKVPLLYILRFRQILNNQ